MARTWEEILTVMSQRRNDDSALIRQMIDTRDRYNADVIIPLKDVDGEPFVAPLGPQILHDGIDHIAMRAASTMPTINVPALDPAKAKGRRSVEYAAIRRRALYAAHHHNMSSLLFGRAFRQLAAYGVVSLVVTPCYPEERAKLELRSSLNAYPDPRAYDDYRPPENVGFVYGRSGDWLRSYYGPGVDDILSSTRDEGGLWDVVEWIDEDDIVIGILGPRSVNGIDHDAQRNIGGLELRRWPNRAGMVPCAVGKRLTLDRIAGQMQIITGATDWLDRLMALNVMAAERNIFPDMYALADEGRVPELVDGQWHDGRTGQINVLANTKAVGQVISGASQHSQQVIAMLTSSTRASGGALPQFGGDLAGARTGRALDTLGSFAVDPRVAEMQHVMEAMLSRTIHPAIMQIEKGYWPDKKYVVFSGSTSDNSYVEYTPSVHFENTENAVAYSFPGMDVSSISVALLQLVGGDLIPKRQARAKHPMIDDPEAASLEVVLERLDEATLVGLQQQVTSGALPLIDQARIRQLVAQGETIADAILKADEEARARQAQTPAPAPEGMGAPPEQMPGLAMPGMGAETQMPPMEGPPMIQGPAPSQENLRHFLRTVRAS